MSTEPKLEQPLGRLSVPLLGTVFAQLRVEGRENEPVQPEKP